MNFTDQHHNNDRLHHAAPPLQWDFAPEASALRWASNLTQRSCFLEHSGAGDNLYMCWPAAGTNCTAAVDAWYAEVRQLAGYHDACARRPSL